MQHKMQKRKKVRGQGRAQVHTHAHIRTMLGQTKCVCAMTFFKFSVFTSKGLQAQMATGWTMQHLLRDIVQLGSHRKKNKSSAKRKTSVYTVNCMYVVTNLTLTTQLTSVQHFNPHHRLLLKRQNLVSVPWIEKYSDFSYMSKCTKQFCSEYLKLNYFLFYKRIK